MKAALQKITLRLSFEVAVERLLQKLASEGFIVTGFSDFQKGFFKPNEDKLGKYKVFSVYIPSLFKAILLSKPDEGLVIPCSVSVIEMHPGEIIIVPFNAIEMAAIHLSDSLLLHFASEVTKRLSLVIQALEEPKLSSPDLTTSWE